MACAFIFSIMACMFSPIWTSPPPFFAAASAARFAIMVRMMGRMTLISLLKQSGADEQAVKQLNRILQRYKKV